MKLFNVSCEIMIDAENAEEAMQKINYFLSGERDVDINFLVHSAEADESFEDIEALRNHQAVEHALAPDRRYCVRCEQYTIENGICLDCDVPETPAGKA